MSIFLAILPIVGLLVSITGLVLSVKGRDPHKLGKITAGIITSIIGLNLSVIVWVISALFID